MVSNVVEDERSEVVVRGLSKSFGNRRVLDRVAFSFPTGTVHGLIGANGSGKSTVIKILAGYHGADRGDGELEIRGETHRLPLQHAAQRQIGLGFVHQDLGLASAMTVAENLFIDDLAPHGLSRVQWHRLHNRARELLGRVGGEHIATDATIAQIAPVDRAIVAIARALSNLRAGGLLVLDEVTTFLPRDDVELLFKLMRQVCNEGMSVLFVSHRLEEIRATCSTVTVLRNGVVAASRIVAETPDDTLVTDIVGTDLGDLYPQKYPPQLTKRMVVKEVTGIGLGPVSFEANIGEIVGVTGLRGMGHESLPYVLYGDQAGLGTVQVDGVVLDLKRSSIHDFLESGVRLVPGDRLRQGAVASATVQENITLPFIREFFRGGWLREKTERRAASELLNAFGVVPRDPSYLYGGLSGGNQQKVLLARWLRSTPTVLLLDEPTQGVDIGARKELFARIVQAAIDGATVIYVSTETKDLAELCHRVLIIRDGTIVKTLSEAEVTEGHILRACWQSTAA